MHENDVRADGGTQSAERVADVLLAVADTHPHARVTDISRRLGVSKAVVHRILRSLGRRGLVVAVPDGAYALGPAAAGLAGAVMRHLDVRRAAMPTLRALAVRTAETATVSLLTGDARVYIDQVVSGQQIRMQVELGRRFPLHAGASGKAILAAAPDDVRRRVLTGKLPALTSRTIVDRQRLEQELRRIARQGVASSRGERQQDAASVAAPIFGLHGEVVGAISVCGPVSRFHDATCRKLAPLISAAAAEVDAALSCAAAAPAAAARPPRMAPA
jgi:IclR family transcriptional regulator, acetate operon repressor